MRKLFSLFAAALVVLTAVSCEKTEALTNNAEGKVVTLSAIIDNGGTKTSLGQEKVGNVYPVLWSDGDKIAVIQGSEIYKFNLISFDNDRQSGIFQLDQNEEYETPFNEDGEIKAFYPYDGVTLEGGDVKYNVPAIQTYSASSFGNGTSPMAAYSATGIIDDLVFENLFGVLKLQLLGTESESVTSVQVKSKNAEINISGTAIVSISQSSSIELTGNNDEDKIITLNCGNGVALSNSAPIEFLIAIPAGTEHAWDVIVNTTSSAHVQYIYTKTTQDKIVQSGQILKMAALNLASSDDVVKGGNNSYIVGENYYGEGIEISYTVNGVDGDPVDKSLIWAPVNCGYHPTSYPNGKLYQWGRKYGQYEGDNIIESPIDPTNYLDNENGNANNLFLMSGNSPGDWLNYSIGSDTYGNLWKGGEKTNYDPCPEGWRVPAQEELNVLVGNNKVRVTSSPQGYRFTGNRLTNSYYGLFLPYTGWFSAFTSGYGFKLTSGTGQYWSSTSMVNNNNERRAYYLSISENPNSSPLLDNYLRASGFAVRCVKE